MYIKVKEEIQWQLAYKWPNKLAIHPQLRAKQIKRKAENNEVTRTSPFYNIGYNGQYPL